MGSLNIADDLRARSSFFGLYKLHDSSEQLSLEIDLLKERLNHQVVLNRDIELKLKKQSI
jgi:hypothetical protein